MDSKIQGHSHIYLDEELDKFSNLALGLFIRAMGHSLRIAYVDVSNSASKITNFFENLSLNYSFIKNFNRINMDIYTFKSKNLISKSILPAVEFNSINRELFFKSILNLENDYDLIIFDNFNLDIISKEEIEILLKKNLRTEIVFVLSKKDEYNSIKDLMNFKIKYNYKNKNNLISNNKIIYIFGDGRGKSIYSFGYIIRNFINKKDVKLIYFDKGDYINGELIFFNALKKWSIMNDLYGKFDFVVNGAKRYLNNNEFRNETNTLDKKEAEEALMLLKSSLKFQNPVIADELGKVMNMELLEKNQVFEILKNVKNELLITGDKISKDLDSISNQTILVENENNFNRDFMKKGIDY